MRQSHRAGEKLFVDYAGQTVEVVDPATGEVRQAEIFVAVLGASNYTFAEATWTQTLPDWIGSHVRAFAFFAGVPELVVPDNLRSGVAKAHRYEPEINPTYADLARHYGVAVLPARARRPRDKAKAEAGVQLVERWILAALRNRTFFSLAELNREIREAHLCLGIFGVTPKALRVIPCKVYDSLAVGRPVVTADTPGARELLEDGRTAVLVPPGDAAALADAGTLTDAEHRAMVIYQDASPLVYDSGNYEPVLDEALYFDHRPVVCTLEER